jgi:xylitol oxidase
VTSPPLRTWAGNHVYPATVVHRPTTVEQVRSVVAGSRRIRAVGTRHCFNDLVDAPELVSLEALPPDVDVDTAASTVRVGAAVRYGHLSAHLHARGWALHNLASLPHIGVAGAVATGTHGSGDRKRCLSAAVAGLDLVTADGGLRTLARGDDDLAGSVVALGALGVVTAVTLDVEPTYDVVQHVHTSVPWSLLLDRFDEVMASADSVSAFTDWCGPQVLQLWRKTRVVPGQGVPAPALDLGSPATTAMHPVPGADPLAATEQLAVAGPWHERLPHFRLDVTPSHGEELQSEYLVARSDGPAAIEAVRGIGDLIAPLLLVSEVRTVAADDLWLSMAHGRDSVALHFTWRPAQDEVEAVLPVLEHALAPFAARPHWGKLFADVDRDLATRYPRLSDFRALAARLDPERTFGNAFLDRHVLDA